VKRRFPLSAVLRVREAREEAARAQAARANALLAAATDRAARREASLFERTLPTDAPIEAFLGAVTATRSIASEVAGLQELARQRQEDLVTAQQDWTNAEQAHSAVERLAERHQIMIQHEFYRAEQRELDELAQRPQQVSDWAPETDKEKP